MIERSPGIPITVGAVTFGLAGGGYRGMTEALDTTVAAAAEKLEAAFGMDVTIRFNSNRQSGGAWLRTHEVDSIGANAEVGIRAQLVTQRIVEVRREIGSRQPGTPGDIEISVLISEASLGDASLRGGPGWNERPGGHGYYIGAVGSLEEALELCLRASVQGQRVQRGDNPT